MGRTATLRRQFAERICVAAQCANPRVRDAFSVVPRERFFDHGPWLAYQFLPHPPYFNYRPTSSADVRHLYDDVSIALDADRNINCGLPSVWAGWLDVVDIRPGEMVLHVGSGAGYYSAVMAELVRPRGAVFAVEIDASLARWAHNALRTQEVVRTVHADGTRFDAGPVDVIIVSAGVTEIPSRWLDALRPGGRLLLTLSFTDKTFPDIGLGLSFLISKADIGEFAARHLSFPYIYSCTNLRTAEQSRQISAAIDAGGWENVRSLRRRAHIADAGCWLHMDRWCLSTREPGDDAAADQVMP